MVLGIKRPSRGQRESREVLRKVQRGIDILYDDLPQLTKLIEVGAFGSPRNIARRRRPPMPMARIETCPGRDGKIQMTLVSNHALTLTPVLAALLLFLAKDTRTSEDELVGWKSLDEVLAAMRTFTGKSKFSAKALKQDIYRLRETLEEAGLQRSLIQTDYIKGRYRFAIRRKEVSVIAGDPL